MNNMGGFPSGQREQTVNLSSSTSVVRIHHLPPLFSLFKIKHGKFPEWPKGTDCKSVVFDFGGSNPPLPTSVNQTLKSLVFLCLFYPKTIILDLLPALFKLQKIFLYSYQEPIYKFYKLI